MAVSVAHTHYSLVEIESRFLQSAPLVTVHEVIVHLLRVDVLHARVLSCERSDAVSQTLLHKVVAEIHVVFLRYCRRDV